MKRRLQTRPLTLDEWRAVVLAMECQNLLGLTNAQYVAALTAIVQARLWVHKLEASDGRLDR